MRSFTKIVVLLLVSAMAGVASENPKPSPALSFDQTVDRVVARERGFVVTMKRMHPLAETYIQNLREDNDHDVEPTSDQYFLGRLDLNNGVRDATFQGQREGFLHHALNPFSAALEYKFLPQGFAQMVVLDPDFQKNNYRFNFVRREFLGEARCIVIDVQPWEKSARRFVYRKNLGRRPRLQYCPLQRDLFRSFGLQPLPALRQLAF